MSKECVLVSAGAGTGKTTFLTEKYVEVFETLISKGLSPYESAKKILAVTFTKKATQEMKQRIIARLQNEKIADEKLFPFLEISTIDSVCNQILKNYAKTGVIDSDFNILSDGIDKIFFNEVFEKIKKNYPFENLFPSQITKQDSIFNLLTQLRSKGISPEEVHNLNYDEENSREFLEFVSKVYSIFLEELKKQNSLDFPQLLYETHKLLKENPEICRQLRDRWKFVFIDEFQDTSPIQLKIFELIDPQFLCVVGDYNQSIYSFRGATPQNMLKVSEKATERHVLDKNFRSTKTILNFANRLKPYLTDFDELSPHKKAPVGEKVKIVIGETRFDEAVYIADEIKKLVSSGYAYRDIYILMRSLKSTASDYEEVFRSKGIPFITVSQGQFLERKEINQIITLLKVFAVPTDDLVFTTFLLSPLIAFTPQQVYELSKEKANSSLFEAFLKTKNREIAERRKKIYPIFEKVKMNLSGSLYQFVLEVIYSFEIPRWIEKNFTGGGKRRALANVKKFLETVVTYEAAVSHPTLNNFIEYLTKITSGGAVMGDAVVSTQDAVEILTIHSAKGLENRVVFVSCIGVSQFPSPEKYADWVIEGNQIFENKEYKKRKNRERVSTEEEWRLFYVAMTRAKEKLYLTGYRTKKGTLSRFMKLFINDKLGTLEREFSSVAEYKTFQISKNTSSQSGPKKKIFVPVFGKQTLIKPFFKKSHVIEKKLKDGFTVTELALFEKDRKEYEKRYILKIPDVQDKKFLKIGNVFHHTIECFHKSPQMDFRREILTALEGWDVDKEKIEQMIKNFLLSAFSKKPLLAEAPFSIRVESTFVKGTIDRIEETRGGFLIYDYKTGIGDVENYEFAMNVYALGLIRAYRMKPVRGLYLYQLQTGKVKEVNFWGEGEVQRKLVEIFDKIRKHFLVKEEK
ncbi:MAG: ATP-dependent helicase [Elusimicrobia bacterium]|nr:ATP-dependent helicase [Elusimicrobiota bacterium]